MDNKKIKIIGLIIGIGMFIGLLVSISYAYYNSRVTSTISGTAGCFDVSYVKGNSISNADLLLYDVSDVINNNNITIKNGMAVTNFSAIVDSRCNIDAHLIVNLTASGLNNAFVSGNSVGALKYAIVEYSPTTYPTVNSTVLNNVSFETIASGAVTIKTKHTIFETDILKGNRKDYLVIFYIDGDLAMNDAGNTTFTASIEAIASMTENQSGGNTGGGETGGDDPVVQTINCYKGLDACTDGYQNNSNSSGVCKKSEGAPTQQAATYSFTSVEDSTLLESCTGTSSFTCGASTVGNSYDTCANSSQTYITSSTYTCRTDCTSKTSNSTCTSCGGAWSIWTRKCTDKTQTQTTSCSGTYPIQTNVVNNTANYKIKTTHTCSSQGGTSSCTRGTLDSSSNTCYSYLSSYNGCSSGVKNNNRCELYDQTSCPSGWTPS